MLIFDKSIVDYFCYRSLLENYERNSLLSNIPYFRPYVLESDKFGQAKSKNMNFH